MTTYDDLILANMALDTLKEPNLADLLGTGNPTVQVNKWLPEARMMVLRLFNWKFALKRVSGINVDGTAPAWGWTYRHAVPADSLRIVDVVVEGTPIVHTEEQGYILSDCNSDFDLRYIEDITDPQTFPAMMVRGLTLLLGAQIAVPISNSKKKEDDNYLKYDLWIKAAQRTDLLERQQTYKDVPGTYESSR